jgi:rare lipoprotein A (peptidoglycan hydrolase)
VLVRAGSRSVRVRLSDWCQCYFRTSRERVIDLSPAAFERLAPLSKGLVKVSVTWN